MSGVIWNYFCDFPTQLNYQGQAWRSDEVLPTCAKRSWVRLSLSALHFAGVRLDSYNPSQTPPSVGASSTVPTQLNYKL